MLGDSISNRVTLGNTMESMIPLRGIYEVSRNLTLSGVVDGDSGNFSCVTTADIPGIGIRNNSVTFQLVVQGKLCDLICCKFYF